jgi:AraC-like DNA-binding protein
VIAAVTQGSFRYRAGQGGATLMPGALLLGNAGEAFECYYEQASGDRCISFNYSVDHFEGAVGAMAGAGRLAFPVHRLAPTPAIVALCAAIEAEASLLDAGGLEEVALRLAGDVVSVLNGGPPADVRPSGRDERRVIDALHLIEARYSEPLSVTALAGAMRMSPYHFLRVFRTVAGVTPHQYLLRTRLRRAAVTLATTNQPIAAIAFAHGFGDLSTFICELRPRVPAGTTGLPPRRARATI